MTILFIISILVFCYLCYVLVKPKNFKASKPKYEHRNSWRHRHVYVIMVLLAIPLGRYIGKIYEGEPTWTDRILNPLDKLFFSSAVSGPKGNELETTSV